MSKLSFVVVAFALTACVADEEVSTSTEAINGGCPEWGCGENSPVIGPYGFHELNVDGFPNNKGVRVANFQIGAKLYKPMIVNGSQLVAYDAATNTYVTGVGLTNGYFNVTTPTGPYKIIISKVTPKASSTVTFWIGPASQIETYELSYTGYNVTGGRVCANPPGRDTGQGDGTSWNAPLEAILYTGDRYDAGHKTVTTVGYRETAGWFNIACAGSALAKLHLNRHTTAGSTSVYLTTADQRQTLLKMYVSDVCGTGSAWTKAGTPLHWANVTGWSHLNGLEYSFESRWSANGASCLDVHRLGNLYADPNDPNSPIYLECNPPPCNGSVSNPVFPAGTYIVTAVPFDPF